jgi:hypothetical protein
MSRHGYHGNGSFGQQCMVVPSHDLVVAVTSGHANADSPAQVVLDAIWECLLPGVGGTGGGGDDGCPDDERLAERLRGLSLPGVPGSAAASRSCAARIDASTEDSAVPDGSAVVVDPVDGGWLLQLASSFKVAVGYGEWRESSPLGRPVVAAGAWQGDRFVADLYVITTPHRVRLVVDAGTGTAVATWSTVPPTSPSLPLHLRAPLMTQPDLA